MRSVVGVLLAATLGLTSVVRGEVRSEWAGMLLTPVSDGETWEDAGDETGPALVSRDLGGERLGAWAVELEPPEDLAGMDRTAQADYLLGYLDDIIGASYGLVTKMEGPFYFGDEGPLVVSWEFFAGDRYNREYLIWDSERLVNLTIWCRAGLAGGLEGAMNALLAQFRW
ncbi:hypothetical protein KAU45_04260 [bacterium]|nr:hypothetical protein [bacterium]